MRVFFKLHGEREEGKEFIPEKVKEIINIILSASISFKRIEPLQPGVDTAFVSLVMHQRSKAKKIFNFPVFHIASHFAYF